MKKDYENVTDTLNEMRADKKPKKGGFFRAILQGLKIKFTTKTTLLFSLLYTALLGIYLTPLLISLLNFLKEQQLETNYFNTVLILSISFLAAFVILGIFLGSFIAKSSLKPVRKIVKQIDLVSNENLSFRVEPVDNQTELKQLVGRINTTLDSLEGAFSQQANFVTDASHELKTPLSVLSGYANLLERWGKTDKAILDEAIEAIKRESAYMSKIVEQMLLLAKIGRFSLSKSKIDLYLVAKEVVEGFRVSGIDCEISLIEGKRVLVDADSHLLTQAVRAIVDNAIKYSRGTVRIFAGQESGHAMISVRDNGAGIEPKDLPHIFDRFYRCDKTRGREKGNAGLGLSICKSIVEVMGGKIDVVSKKNEGCEFRIFLDRAE